MSVIDDNDRRILEKKLDNELSVIIESLKPYQQRLKAVAVESTFNWYWLVDGLMEAGFEVRLVNTAKVVQYNGLKRTDDRYDAYHLAHLMRLGILPTGYIYPKAERGLRDLLRKRMQLVQNRTQHIVSFKTQYQRLTGSTIASNALKSAKFVCPVLGDANVQLALQSNLLLVRQLSEQVKCALRRPLKLRLRQIRCLRP